MSTVTRKYIPMAIMIFIAIILFVDYFFETPPSYKQVSQEVQNFNIIIAAFALILGNARILELQGKKLMKREPEQWPFSLLMIGVMVTVMAVGLIFGSASFQLNWLYATLFQQPSASVFSLIGWVIFYAVYLSFRIDNRQMLFFTIIWFFAMMGNAPIGGAIWDGFPAIQSWIELVPNTAATRGYYIANTLSATVIGFRTLLGRTSMGMGE